MPQLSENGGIKQKVLWARFRLWYLLTALASRHSPRGTLRLAATWSFTASNLVARDQPLLRAPLCNLAGHDSRASTVWEGGAEEGVSPHPFQAVPQWSGEGHAKDLPRERDGT